MLFPAQSAPVFLENAALELSGRSLLPSPLDLTVLMWAESLAQEEDILTGVRQHDRRH